MSETDRQRDKQSETKILGIERVIEMLKEKSVKVENQEEKKEKVHALIT